MNSSFAFQSHDFWLDDPLHQLKQVIQNKKLPHALLIDAPKGFAQNTLAQILSAFLLCDHNHENRNNVSQKMMACHQCKSCQLLNSNTHPDYHWIKPLIEKGKQKQTIGISQIRELTQQLLKTPQYNGWRIAVIDSLVQMNIASFNGLLKTLEEPKSQTLLILLNEGYNAIPATIKSRCQRIILKADPNQTLTWLSHKKVFIQHSNTSIKKPLDSKKYLRIIEICHLAPYATLDFIQKGFMESYLTLMNDLDGLWFNQSTPYHVLEKNKALSPYLLSWIGNYFHYISKQQQLNLTSKYKDLVHDIPYQCYNELIQLNKAQNQGHHLQLLLQLEAILIRWLTSKKI
jgi:DNA polymerase-3 subunit delta'